MSEKPTGVFVRLPLSATQREQYLDVINSGEPLEAEASALEAGILAIGTPVTGGNLQPIGKVAGHFSDGQPMVRILNHPHLPYETEIALYDDAQAQIAALEAEVVRLRGIVNILSSKIAECGSEGYDLSGADCVDMLNDAGLIEWGTFDPEVHESWMFDGCEAGDPIWTLKGPEA